MRKNFKKKKRSCALCKPHKMNGQSRWKDKELQARKLFEKLKNKLI